MTPFKILQIITRLDRGGSSESVIELCKKLNPSEFSPVVLVYGGKNPTDYDLSDIKYRYHIRTLTRNISPLKDTLAFFTILKVIIKENPHIVHTHTSKAGILGRWAAFLARSSGFVRKSLKIIHTPHGHIFYGYYPASSLRIKFFILVEKITSRITDCLVALTEGEKNETIRLAGLPQSVRWKVIHSGINFSHPSSYRRDATLKELGILPDSILIGTVARLEPVKGIIYFIKASKLILEEVKRTNQMLYDKIHFLIVGDGSLGKELESLAGTMVSLPNRIIFTGMRNDVTSIISAMDIYIQPSLNEGMGKTIVEAMSLAKPVVATDVQGIPDLIKNNITGLLVPPADEKALAGAILKILFSPSLAKSLGEKARDYVTEKVDGYPRFSTERMLHLYRKLYYEEISK